MVGSMRTCATNGKTDRADYIKFFPTNENDKFQFLQGQTDDASLQSNNNMRGST